jgi:uncharacterized protein (DUF697 family)
VVPEAQQAAFDFCQKASWDRKIRKAQEGINWAVAATGGAAAIPLPGGHTAALIAIEAGMLLRINKALGLTLEEGKGKDIVMGVMGIVGATVGGKMLFAEALKFVPAVGTIGGALVGGTVAVFVSKVLGELYLEVVSELAKKDGKLPDTTVLIDILRNTFTQRKDEFFSRAYG